MECIVFKNLDSAEIFDSIVDKRYNSILLHNLRPHEPIGWRQMSINIPGLISLENMQIRTMQFDMQTDLLTLKRILSLNTLYLSVYQFDKPIPDTLLIDNLPAKQWDDILRKNGLQHVISNEFENTRVYSFDSEFLTGIRENSRISDRIIVNSLSDVNPVS